MNANTINAHFRKLGIRARICRGEGYYYWLDEKRDACLEANSVYVFRASDLTLEHWVELALSAQPAT
jgi:hypothetical protein